MKIVAIIPARMGSKSVHLKNIKKLGNHPLIAYTISIAHLSKHISEIIVSTDNEKIAEISLQYGAKVPFLRPKEISLDTSTDLEFFQHYINYAKTQSDQIPEYLIHLRPTTPLRKIEIVDKGIEYMLSNESATSMRSVYQSPFTPYKVFKMENQYLKGFFPHLPQKEYYNLPRQSFPDSFIPNGYIDIVRTSIINAGNLHGDRILGYETEKLPDIDVADDFEYAEAAIQKKDFKKLIQFLKDNYE